MSLENSKFSTLAVIVRALKQVVFRKGFNITADVKTSGLTPDDLLVITIWRRP